MMAIRSPYLFVASMDVPPDKEAEFHALYEEEHIPMLRRVPGVGRASRLELQDFSVLGAAASSFIPTPGHPRFSAFYEIEGPHVLASAEWEAAARSGRWPEAIRPVARNRRHELLKVIYPT
jgi:hypothetical protein